MGLQELMEQTAVLLMSKGVTKSACDFLGSDSPGCSLGNYAVLYILVAQRGVSLFIHTPLRLLRVLIRVPRHISKFSSEELITTTILIHITGTMKLKELPQVMEFVSCEHAPFPAADNGPCRPNFSYGECYYPCPATCAH